MSELERLNCFGNYDQFGGYYDADEADKVIAELKEERRWRKFPDEKPTEDTKFLVINEKGFMQCCYYSPILKEFQIPVTHWMPLPKTTEE